MPTFSESDNSLATTKPASIDGDSPTPALDPEIGKPPVAAENDGAVEAGTVDDGVKAAAKIEVERLALEKKTEADAEKAEAAAAFNAVLTPLRNALAPLKNGFVAPFRLALLVVWWLVVLWVAFYAAHILIPSSALPDSVGYYKDNFFYDADVFFGRKSQIPYDFRENSVEQATKVWIANCLFAELDPEAQPTNSADLAYWKRATATAANLRGFSGDLAYKSQRYREELDQFRNKSVWYSSVLIMLGMLTTIVSALNSSQFGSGPTLSASTIKIVAIILPALATAITAYSALNAPTEAASMRSQLIYNVASLGAQMTTDLNQLSCSSRVKFEDLNKKVADWSQKYADTVVGIELSQGRPKSSSGNQVNISEGEDKDDDKPKTSEVKENAPLASPTSGDQKN